MTRIRETLTSTPEVQTQSLDIPDQPGHYYALTKITSLATGAEPSEAEGESLLDNKVVWYTTFEYWQGGKDYIDHGYWERLMPSGDRIFHTFDGQTGEVEIVGGTDKFEGIKGKGLYKGEEHAGVWQGWYEWEYELSS